MENEELSECPECNKELTCYVAFLEGQRVWLYFCPACKWEGVQERL